MLPIRRALVVAGVVMSLVIGVASIRVAAALAQAAAPPPAPPVSIESLKDALAAEQGRGEALQQQLDELTQLTSALSDALSGAKDQVKTEGLTAQELAKRLQAAQAKLAQLKVLLAQAEARLAALKAAGNPPTGGGGGGGGSAPGGGGGGGGGGGAPPASGFSLALSLSGGNVRADWTACNASNFTGYALVRSTKYEVHFPPESGNTEVARITSRSTTAFTDTGAPAGTMTYQVFCLFVEGSETKFSAQTAPKSIVVP